MSKLLKNKSNFLIIFFLSIAILITVSAILYYDFTIRSEASGQNISVTDYRPNPVIEGTDTTILINGENFSSNCTSYIDNKLTRTKYINRQSLEIELPQEIKNAEIKLSCNEYALNFVINFKPKLTVLP